MKISRISAYVVELPRGGTFRMSGGRGSSVWDSTVVVVETDTGLKGLGEVCPLGATYIPAYAAGARTGMALIAPNLIGADPCELEAINRRMDGLLKGHPYVKSALDIACWDILGQASGLPLVTLLGGRFRKTVPLYQVLSFDTPAAMAAQLRGARAKGYRAFQAKVGGDVATDIARIRALAAAARPGDRLICDANGGWIGHEAARVVRAVRDLDIFIEQPCATYEACLTIRRRTDRPFILDESIDSIPAVLRAHADGAMDGVNLKISKFGGLTRARQFRDLCVALGVPMTIEEAGGGNVAAAAVAAFAQSTPEPFHLSTSNSYFEMERNIAFGAPAIKDAAVSASDRPGLGLTLRPGALGEPVLDTGASLARPRSRPRRSGRTRPGR